MFLQTRIAMFAQNGLPLCREMFVYAWPLLALIHAAPGLHGEEPDTYVYQNRLTPIKNPQPLLADHPEFVQPIVETRRFEAPLLVNDLDADLEVRGWRFSYNARGIIEIPNRLRADQTAVILVHPWGIDDGQGWKTPEPAGVSFFCTPEKNDLYARHLRAVVDPFLQRLRPDVAFMMYSSPGHEQAVQKLLYRSVRGRPAEEEREQGRKQLKTILDRFHYNGNPLPEALELSRNTPVIDYFKQFPGLDSGTHYNGKGFWDLPIPVCAGVSMQPDDVVIYDQDGYPVLRDFLQANGVRHVLLAGYATDMCFRETTAGYKNLSKDFNVFLVGDATMATFPANKTPRHATNAHISYASLNHLITQVSWIRHVPSEDSSTTNE